jgi:hypothetical protein
MTVAYMPKMQTRQIRCPRGGTPEGSSLKTWEFIASLADEQNHNNGARHVLIPEVRQNVSERQ